VVRVLDIVNGRYTFGEPYFEVKTIHLADGEDDVITIGAAATKSDVSFALEVDYETAGKTGSFTVDDNGSPFRVTGYSCRNGQLAYPHAYAETGGDGPLGLVPKQPDRPDLCG